MAHEITTAAMDVEVVADENGSRAALAKYGRDGEFCPQIWADYAISRIDATKDEAVRLGIRDEAVRVAAIAAAVGNLDAEVLAQEVVQRVHRAIGQAHPRQSGGRPASAARDAKNPSTDEKVLSATTVHRYRADAEAVSDSGFEKVAEAAREAGQPLNRTTVHGAGRLEAEGADPADAVRQQAAADPAPQDARVAEPPKDGSSGPLVPADAATAPLHVCAVEALRDRVKGESIDAFAVALHSVQRAWIYELLMFAEHTVRPGGLVLAQCPIRAVGDVVRIMTEPNEENEQWVSYKSLLACVVPGTKANWFPVLVFRQWSDDKDSARRRPTLFRAGTGVDAWRQVFGAWLPRDSEVWDPSCGRGEVLVGAAAAGMRIVGADADTANVEATRAALEAAARRSANAAAGGGQVT